MKKFHFISGLPRAGSTLLSAILKQNPRFTAGISDPLQGYIHSIIRDTNSSVGMSALVKPDKMRDLIYDLFESFYKDGNDVCFNTNRGWAADTALLADLFPDFKMIVCVRDINWILNSFEHLNSKNPYTTKPLYNHQELATVYDRTNMLLGNIPNFVGYVGSPLTNVKQAVFCKEVNNICFVEYEALVMDPKEVMKLVYHFLEEEWFEHDFNNVEDSYEEYDEPTKFIGLHDVRKEVKNIPKQQLLPNDLWAQTEQLSFWKYNFEYAKEKLNWIGLIHVPDE